MEYHKYEIVRYMPEFREQVLKLQTYLWGQDSISNDAYFRWKYEENPYHELPNFHVALYRGEVVGMRGFIGTRWEVNKLGQQYRWLAGADSVVHPQHRRQGLYSKISTAEISEFSNSVFDFIISLSTGPTTTSGNFKMGWRSPGTSLIAERTAFKPKKSRIQAWKAKVRYLPGIYKVYRFFREHSKGAVHKESMPSAPFERFDMNFEKYQAPFLQISLSQQPRPADMARLIKTLDYDGRARHIRDEEYFTWRFKNPRSVYRFLFYEQDFLRGYLVLRCPKSPGAMTFSIVDIEAVDQETWNELLQAAMAWGDANNLSLWATTLSPLQKSALQHLGFQIVGQKVSNDSELLRPSVLIRSLKPAGTENDWCVDNRSLLDISNWDLRAIYADGF